MRYIYSILFVVMLAGCGSGSGTDTRIFEALQKLDAGSMIVDIEIDGKKFYPLDLPFKGSITINELAFFVNLRNPEGGNIVISIEDEDWYKAESKKIQFEEAMPLSGHLYGSLLVGRRTNTDGEGYLLKEGYFEIKQMNQEACIITINGVLKNPFNDEITKPINGYIVWKKPPSLDPKTTGAYFFN
ncbi:hypothetical protein [Jiulongibacter sediminis]|uniref:Lipoprotein n=1 Tax=Jiulongibacter sediminis TaxID=1605367 RepID=A0A0P7BU54_9BACT|nr:hypothetical protein [Jiulongibacter sediminis]KPM48218.1 hypothetical protein AFM12_06025 [Jiulongibacter sediminis]TBX24761.1 hypothetical protein TK44_06030 [Jiulongibacter sediminis]